MPITIPDIAVPYMTQNIQSSFEFPVASGGNIVQYAFPVTPADMSFDHTTRILSGPPSERFYNKEFHYVARAQGMQGDIGVANVLLTSLAVNENPRLHESKFFKYPINYLDFDIRNVDINGDEVPQIADNDYNTFGTSTRYVIDISDGSNATSFTHIFLKSTGVSQISISSSGGVHTNETGINIPTTVVNYAGIDVRINPDGYQNYLHESYDRIGNKPTATSLTIEVDAGDVYELMILDEVMFLDSNRQYTEISYKLSDRSSILQKDIADRITKVPGINDDRWKWDTDYQATFLAEHISNIDPNEDLYNKLINFIRNRPVSNNFVFCGEYSAYPERVAPCTFPNTDMQVAFLSRSKSSGESINFTVMEL